MIENNADRGESQIGGEPYVEVFDICSSGFAVFLRHPRSADA
jgi:hypothetical protein